MCRAAARPWAAQGRLLCLPGNLLLPCNKVASAARRGALGVHRLWMQQGVGGTAPCKLHWLLQRHQAPPGGELGQDGHSYRVLGGAGGLPGPLLPGQGGAKQSWGLPLPLPGFQPLLKAAAEQKTEAMDNNLSPLLRFSHTELLPAPTAHAGGAGTGRTQPEPAQNGLEEATLRKAQRGSGLHVEPAGTWAWPMDSPGPRGAKTPLMQPPRLHSGACSCREPWDGRRGGRSRAQLSSCQAMSPHYWSTALLQLLLP